MHECDEGLGVRVTFAANADGRCHGGINDIATMAPVVVLVMPAMVCAVPDIQGAVDALAQLQANDGV